MLIGLVSKGEYDLHSLTYLKTDYLNRHLVRTNSMISKLIAYAIHRAIATRCPYRFTVDGHVS